MSVIQGLTTAFKVSMLQQGQNLSTDTFKIALYNNPPALDYTTTVYSPTSEVAAPGYTAGGQVLTGAALVTSGNTVYLTFNNASWSGAMTATCALIYNATRGNSATAILDFGGPKTSTSTFTVVMPAPTATTALLRF